jgi:osmotically inducible lipoprotein OsmB
MGKKIANLLKSNCSRDTQQSIKGEVMKRILIVMMIGLTSLALLTGCTSSQRKDAGMVAGGVVGGVAGNALTGGSAVGTVVGAVGGAYVGRQVSH